MTTPSTKNRIEEIDKRISVLGFMITELTTRQSRYYQNPRFASLHPQVMQELYAEQLKLSIERNVLLEYFSE